MVIPFNCAYLTISYWTHPKSGFPLGVGPAKPLISTSGSFKNKAIVDLVWSLGYKGPGDPIGRVDLSIINSALGKSLGVFPV